VTRTGARGTPPPPHRRRSIFRDDPPDPAPPDIVLPDGFPPRIERSRAEPHAAEGSTTAAPGGALVDGPGSVRPRPGRAHRSIFRPEAEHHVGPER
jgi:hypothetical protein